MAKKANSVLDGTPIQIKRTKLGTDDPKVIADGALMYGEPLYVDGEQKLLLFGDSAGNTETKNLQAFSSESQSLSPRKIFYRQTNGESPVRVDLVDKSDSVIYTKFRTFTKKRDADGIPVDVADATNIIYCPTYSEAQARQSSDLHWKKVNSDGSIQEGDAGESDFPKAIKIPITNMTSDVIPYIGLSLSNAQLGSASESKKQKKSFGNISAVNSYNGGIIIYCCYKNVPLSVYMDVFGG